METRKKKVNYSLDDADAYVLAPGSDSELSELDGEEDVENFIVDPTLQTLEDVNDLQADCNKENDSPKDKPVASTSTCT